MTPRPRARLRVLVVTQYYPPEAHGAIARSLAVELADRGHHVEVLTTFPNHPYGRLFPGWTQRFGHVESDGGVLVRRVPTMLDHSLRASRRILSYLSFAVSALTASRAAWRADVVYVYGAQPTAAIAPMLWRTLFGTPYVLHVQDIWPESVLGSGMLPSGVTSVAARRLILRWLRRVHSRAARVIAIGPGAARLLESRGADPARTTSCPNWVTTSTTTPAGARPSREGTRIVYAGSIGPAQGLEAVVRAAARCQDLAGLRFTIIGDGVHRASLEALAARLGAHTIDFAPPVPRERMTELHAATGFAIVSLGENPMTAVTIPSKLQDLLANGVPVLGALDGDAAAMLRDARAGFVAPPGDVDALEAVFRAAHAASPSQRERFSAAGRAYAVRSFSLVHGVDHVEHALTAAARPVRPAPPIPSAPEGAPV